MYFDQQMHACACMVENDKKHWKMMKKVPFPSCAREAHVRLVKKNKEKSLLVSGWEWLPKAGCYASHAQDGKGTFFMIFECFLSFSTCKCMPKHASAGQNTRRMTFPLWYSFQNSKCLKCGPRPSLFQMNYL